MKFSAVCLAFLLVLLLSQPSLAAGYTWANGQHSAPSAEALCQKFLEKEQARAPSFSFEKTVTFTSETSAQCRVNYANSSSQSLFLILRRSGECDGTFNSQTGGCDAPIECPEAGTDTTASVSCSLQGDQYVTPDSISISGCGYVRRATGYFRAYPNFNDPASTYCMTSYSATGDPAAPGTNDPAISEDATLTPPTEGDTEAPCLTADGHTFCQDPENPTCGTRDGNPFCYTESDSCGELNGEFVCLPKGERSCTYQGGQYECVDTKTGTKIDTGSADHPDNGGNGDGNDGNDEQAADNVAVGEGKQGTDKGATNKSVTDLQTALGEKLDDINRTLGKSTPTGGSKPVQPTERGSFDLEEWDEKIETSKAELSTLTNELGDLFEGITSLNLSGSGGQLYCDSYTVNNKTYELCIDKYADELNGIGLVVLFIAALLAALIIFKN